MSDQLKHVMKEYAEPGVLAALLSLTSDAVLGVDAQGRVSFANEEAERLAWRGQEALVGLRVDQLFYTPDHQPYAAGAWPFPADGSTTPLTLRLEHGGYVPVLVRADRVRAAGDLRLVVVRPSSEHDELSREHDRLVRELRQANHRLSGTLRIVLDTLDTEDLGTLFDTVLEELRDTMDATGSLLYIASQDGYRLQGVTESVRGANAPLLLPYGCALATLVTRSGHALRLRVAPPSKDDLRAGAAAGRDVTDEDTHISHRVATRRLPPFTSFLCVPVLFGDNIIALIQIGWHKLHPTTREDARLMDAVAQYLSVQLMAATTALRMERQTELDRLVDAMRDDVLAAGFPVTGDLYQVMGERAAHALDARCVILRSAALEGSYQAELPVSGDTLLTLDLPDATSSDPVVLPVSPDAGKLGELLETRGEPCMGALVDLGVLVGERRVVLFLRPEDQGGFDELEMDFLRHLANVAVDAARDNLTRRRDTAIAQALQLGMRNVLQEVPGITAQGTYSSATASAYVGGDFYDLVRLPDRKACVILGDVSGKGVEAASVSSAVRTALEAYSWEGLAPARMVELLNDFLLGFARLETFATLFVGVVDLAGSTLTYCSAGHPPALLLRAHAPELRTLDVQSGVVGAFKEMSYRDGFVSLVQGDTLLLYTDGVTEARAQDGSFFGEEGLRDAVVREAQLGSAGLVERLLGDIDSFTGNSLEDDVAIVALTFDELG